MCMEARGRLVPTVPVLGLHASSWFGTGLGASGIPPLPFEEPADRRLGAWGAVARCAADGGDNGLVLHTTRCRVPHASVRRLLLQNMKECPLIGPYRHRVVRAYTGGADAELASDLRVDRYGLYVL